MSCYNTILRAAHEAARFAWPELHESLVTWDEESAAYGPAHITLVVVSEVDEDASPIKIYTKNGSVLDVRLVQRGLLNIDVRVECPEGTYADRSGEQPARHFLRLARQFRMAWGLAEIRTILANPQYPAVLTGNMGPIVNRSRDQNGVTLPMCSFELQFRALLGDINDPTSVGVINTIAATGAVTVTGDAPVTTAFSVTRP